MTTVSHISVLGQQASPRTSSIQSECWPRTPELKPNISQLGNAKDLASLKDFFLNDNSKLRRKMICTSNKAGIDRTAVAKTWLATKPCHCSFWILGSWPQNRNPDLTDTLNLWLPILLLWTDRFNNWHQLPALLAVLSTFIISSPFPLSTIYLIHAEIKIAMSRLAVRRIPKQQLTSCWVYSHYSLSFILSHYGGCNIDGWI